MKILVSVEKGDIEKEVVVRLPENFNEDQIEEALNDNYDLNGWYNYRKI